MKMKKLFVSLMAALMVLSSVQIAVFADTEVPELGTGDANFMAEMMLTNGDCKEIESLKNADLSVKITKNDDAAITASAAVTYDEEMEYFSASAKIDTVEMQMILEELSAKQNALLEESMEELNDALEELDELNIGEDAEVTSEAVKASKMLRNRLADVEEEVGVEEVDLLEGYTVTLEGLPEGGHFTPEFTGSVVNNEAVILVFDMMKGLLEGFLSEEDKALNLEADTYIGLMDEIAKMEGFDSYEASLLAEEYTEEEIEEEMALYVEMDRMLTLARNGEYPPVLNLIGAIDCACPIMEYYEIYHEYYKEDLEGNRTLVARVQEGEEDEFGMILLEGEAGSYIRAEDYIQCEYDGVTYEYVNSYDSFVVYDEQPNWEQDIVTEFKLGDWTYSGLALRYVAKEEPPVVEPVVDDGGEADAEAEPQADVDADAEVSPATGDHTQIVLYVVILVTALAAVLVLHAYKKRK